MAGPIRQPIDIKSLERYIASNAPEIKTPIDLKQFGYGQSNPTYQIIDNAGKKFVMRKKPPGQLLSATAHKVDREYRIIHAMEQTDVPVPRAICLCQDPTVIGTDFYIMSFLDGRIFQDPSIPGVSPEERRIMWKDAVETLAKYHKVKPADVNLSNYGKHWSFFNRQLKTFNTISAAQAKAIDIETKVPVGEIPHFKEMVAFFSDPKTQPKDRSTFVHGDYKIDNMVFHKTEPRVIGVIDWELATIGHPLSDLTNLLNPFTTAESPYAAKIGRMNKAFQKGACPGLPTKEECIQWYQDASGYDPRPDLTWGEAFGIYRGCIIMQGIAARYALRQASSPRAKEYGQQMKPWAELSWELIQDCMKGEKAKL
ncbi:acyl-CoA dehydrogenase family member 11 [Rhizodiscina lignyota]|uniref:Acyl-CoA dehydrogenase family member 11 n=1 Tax=Rhizodiscina lignyota TaxID=1504668 RepID=A0A9P4I7G6_9PEZI|nr:acyl-CoA dehydrogenase family member 11 [Rhizodiscina lignyota]